MSAFRKFPVLCMLTVVFICLSLGGSAQVRILFDATKAEMAGNADWVIDADQTTLGVGSSGPYLTSSGHQSNPQQIPTPAQSGISSGTSETYWTGALSAWGVDCAKKGYTVETLPWNGQITYGDGSNAQDLSHYQVYIIDEPNLVFNAAEKTAIIQFVQNGGGLFIISDHNGSDRNFDGWDSPAIWNDLFTNNSISSNPFGITFDLADFSQATTNISAAADDSIIHGPMGNVGVVQWAGGTTMSLNPAKNPTIKGVVFKTGTTPGNSNVMVAYGRYGLGKIAAMGDSSPTDDGTGNPTCTLYNGYFADASGNHQLLLMNITMWLADNPAAGASTLSASSRHITVYPNPVHANSAISIDEELNDADMIVSDASGRIILQQHLPHIGKNESIPVSLGSGFYLVKIISDKYNCSAKLTVY